MRTSLATKHYIPALDGLRGIAVLLVLWTHIPPGVLPFNLDQVRGFVQPGYLGVDIFFVLSGFLITRILLADKEKEFPLRYFLLRRFFRIFPIYYMTLALFTLFHPVPGLGWCFSYLSNFYFPFHGEANPLQHTWSLAVEEHFYLIWPMLVYLLPRPQSRNVALFGFIPLAVLCAVAVILSPSHPLTAQWLSRLREQGTLASSNWTIQFIYMGSMFRFSSLALGSLLAYIESSLHRRAGLFFFVALASFAGAELTIQFFYHLGPYFNFPAAWWPLIRLVCFTAISGSVVLAGVTAGHLRWVPLFLVNNAPLRWIGRVSYGLYLYHFPIFYFSGFYDAPAGQLSLFRVAAAAAGAIAVASLSYLVIERPILNYAARFRARVGARASSAA